MPHHGGRPRSFAFAAAAVLVAVGIAALVRIVTRPPASAPPVAGDAAPDGASPSGGPSAAPAPAAPPPLARDQLFFVGEDPETHLAVLAALVLQREPTASGARIEAKAFLVWQGRWQSPFYQSIDLDTWPGPALEDALAAYARAGAARLRIDWREVGGRLGARLRLPASTLSIETGPLRDAGRGRDPYGEVRWQTGAASLAVGGRGVDGLLVLETLARAEAREPRFGHFEMWLFAPATDRLVLGRCGGPGARAGAGSTPAPPACTALVVGASDARTSPWWTEVTATRADPASGYALPARWRAAVGGGDPVALDRLDGSVGRGRGQDGRVAAYDIAHAAAGAGSGAALVFHLQDEP